ncbi:uncharacterized protein F4807DRAFT_151436 [Annulohypoxylon truncatum]|uniref:uncharacterized protein n=1 Tax=Annulohypoxylon truncatum TaxID=327061 RepID=UPI00200836DB|nr:uncharacterized protein F4807DRAFT_151436 [Annulohypoxylon truncatum]KAI1208416.1 hypothetical protein F4807DRAFT_151436 [Annulohypoxylon truncatum]
MYPPLLACTTVRPTNRSTPVKGAVNHIMPTYLCHGFRWHRPSIRYFVVIQNVDDAAPEWIVTRKSPVALLDQFYELFDFLPPCTRPARTLSPFPHPNPTRIPSSNGHAHARTQSEGGQVNKGKQNGPENGENGNNSEQIKSPSRSKTSGQLATNKRQDDATSLPSPGSPEFDDSVPFNDWSVVKFLEEFDPTDLSVVSGPWAYVADYVIRIDTSVSVAEEIGRYEARMKTEAYKPMSGISEEEGRKVNTFGSKKAGWFEKLRDQLQRLESIRWYVVVCGDEDRIIPQLGTSEEGQNMKRGEEKSGGFVEDGFEFRLPEFLAPQQSSEPRPRRRRAEKKLALEKPAPIPENEQPVIPLPPTPVEATPKISGENLKRPKSSKSNSGLRRLFLRRKPDSPT